MLPEIQYLRAVAVLLVFEAHSELAGSWLHFSYYFRSLSDPGVSLFFVISGFVVGGSLHRSLRLDASRDWLDNLENNVVALKKFFIKRVYRLFPVVLLLIAIFILTRCFVPALAPSQASPVESEMALLSHLSVQNDIDAMVMHHRSAPARDAGHFWTLSAEERFYLVFPVMMIAAGSLDRLSVWALAVVLGTSLLRALYPFNGFTNYLSGWLRFDAFLFGFLVYYLHEHTNVLRLLVQAPEGRRAQLAWRVGLNLFTLLVLLVLCRLPICYTDETIQLNTSFEEPAYFKLCVYAASAVLVALAAQNKGFVLAIPGLRWLLMWIGDRSYCIYVFQIYCFRLVTIFEQWHFRKAVPAWQHAALTLLFTFSLTELIYRGLECPLRDRGRRIATQLSNSVLSTAGQGREQPLCA